MSEQKDLIKKADQTPEEFIKLQDLTKKDLQRFTASKVQLKHQKTKSGFDRCFIQFKLHELLPITLPLSLDRFNSFILNLNLPLTDERNRKLNDYVLDCHFRFVKGNTEYGEYKSVELIFDVGVYQIYFFTKNYDQLQNLNRLEDKKMIKINWYFRPDKISDQDISNYTWE